MNIGFFIGKILEIEKFKFIINSKDRRKSRIVINVELLDGNIIKAIAYDETADYILRNDYFEKEVFIKGRLECILKEMQVVIHYIKIIS